MLCVVDRLLLKAGLIERVLHDLGGRVLPVIFEHIFEILKLLRGVLFDLVGYVEILMTRSFDSRML